MMLCDGWMDDSWYPLPHTGHHPNNDARAVGNLQLSYSKAKPIQYVPSEGSWAYAAFQRHITGQTMTCRFLSDRKRDNSGTDNMIRRVVCMILALP
jgi:hypothetical protein